MHDAAHCSCWTALPLTAGSMLSRAHLEGCPCRGCPCRRAPQQQSQACTQPRPGWGQAAAQAAGSAQAASRPAAAVSAAVGRQAGAAAPVRSWRGLLLGGRAQGRAPPLQAHGPTPGRSLACSRARGGPWAVLLACGLWVVVS